MVFLRLVVLCGLKEARRPPMRVLVNLKAGQGTQIGLSTRLIASTYELECIQVTTDEFVPESHRGFGNQN